MYSEYYFTTSKCNGKVNEININIAVFKGKDSLAPPSYDLICINCLNYTMFTIATIRRKALLDVKNKNISS